MISLNTIFHYTCNNKKLILSNYKINVYSENYCAFTSSKNFQQKNNTFLFVKREKVIIPTVLVLLFD